MKFRLRSQYSVQTKQKNYFCQCCGAEITGQIAFIDQDKKLYCFTRRNLYVTCASQSSEQTDIEVSNALSPNQIQQLIAKGKVIQFGPLEKLIE